MKKFFLLMCICAVSGFSETWSKTNIQYLYGNNFDKVVGDSISNSKMETITIEHVGGWKYGKNFFFVDLTSADFDSGKKHKVYAEFAPKLSMAKMSGTDLSWGIIKDVYASGEINQGDNSRAINLGLAVAVDIAGFNFLDLNLFTRKDNLNDRTMQLTLAWGSDFKLGSVPLVFEGFLDYYGTDSGTVLLTQPRLLLDGKVFGDDFKDLQAGIELYCYRASGTPRINETVPQLMLKWIW